jgi:hypothetical protein
MTSEQIFMHRLMVSTLFVLVLASRLPAVAGRLVMSSSNSSSKSTGRSLRAIPLKTCYNDRVPLEVRCKADERSDAPGRRRCTTFRHAHAAGCFHVVMFLQHFCYAPSWTCCTGQQPHYKHRV